tara:strand:- start:158 stop:2461 length:2304 start_codon:yes stop_codon:yes gene_type:complete
MATTYNTYTGDNSTVDFAFTFPYLKSTDIKVSLDSVVQTLTTHYTLHNATTIRFGSAPGTGVTVKIYRETAGDELTATFYPGSAIRSADLNDNYTQNLYVTQEAKNNTDDATTTANNALTQANLSVPYTLVANKAALLAASPDAGDMYEVTDTTNIDTSSGGTITWVTSTGASDTLPSGVTWDSGLTAKMKYYSTTNKWEFVKYWANDPEGRYVFTAGDTATGNIILDNDKEIRFNEADANGSAYVGIKGATDKGSEGSYTVSLPADAPTANQILKADASTPTNLTWADEAANATHVTATDNESTNEDNLITFVENGTSTTGNVGLEMDGDFHYNPSTGTVTATVFKGDIDANDGDFDGTLEADAITVGGTALNTVIAGVTVTDATNSAHVLVTDNESTNEENLITFVEGATDSTGNVGLEMDGNLTYNPSTGTVSATVFKGDIDANDGDFDGTLEADAITIGGVALDTYIASISVGSATNSAHVLVTDNESTDEENLITFVENATDATGNVGLEMDGTLTYNPSSGTVTATVFKGDIDANDGDFDGTLEADAITVGGTALNTVIAGVTVTNATNAAHVSVADNESTNEDNLITFIENASATGNVGLESDGDFHYNPSTGTVTATVFKGSIDAAGKLNENANITGGKLSDNQNIDLSYGNVFLFTTQESTTSTPNLRYDGSTTLTSKMAVGDVVSIVIMITAHASGFAAQLTIDGGAVTENWVGGSAPDAGGSSGLDIYSYTIIKTGTSGTADNDFKVVANCTKTSS